MLLFLQGALIDAIARLRPELAKAKLDEGEEEEDDDEALPFVCQKFVVIGASHAEGDK